MSFPKKIISRNEEKREHLVPLCVAAIISSQYFCLTTIHHHSWERQMMTLAGTYWFNPLLHLIRSSVCEVILPLKKHRNASFKAPVPTHPLTGQLSGTPGTNPSGILCVHSTSHRLAWWSLAWVFEWVPHLGPQDMPHSALMLKPTQAHRNL